MIQAATQVITIPLITLLLSEPKLLRGSRTIDIHLFIQSFHVSSGQSQIGSLAQSAPQASATLAIQATHAKLLGGFIFRVPLGSVLFTGSSPQYVYKFVESA